MPGDEVPSELLVQMIAVTLDAEGALIEHVLSKGNVEVSDPSVWSKICTAAAWVVLQVPMAFERQSRRERTLIVAAGLAGRLDRSCCGIG